MPAGDTQRAWFPEMLEDLKSHFSSDMSWEELAAFCRDMTEKRHRIREARNIKPARRTCGECGGNMVLPPVSIRSALFALRKINVINESELKRLDQEWNKHRKAHCLDAWGNKSGSS